MSTKQTRTRGEDYQAPVPVPKIKRTRGRPSEYDEAYLPQVIELVEQGATSLEIAEQLDIAPVTFWRWCKAYPELRSAVKGAKDAQDDRVEESLRINAVLNGNVTAQIFWLKNRQPDKWRDRKETEIIVPVTEDDHQIDARGAALAALALFSEAQYDPAATGVLLEATANAEETDDGNTGTQGFQGSTEPGRALEPEDDDDWGQGVDLDPGEL